MKSLVSFVIIGLEVSL